MTTRDSMPFEFIRRERLAVAILLTVAVLAGLNWIQDPEQAPRWLVTMLALPLVFLAMTLWYAWTPQSALPTDDGTARQHYFHAALTLAALAIGIRQVTRLGLEIWVRVGDHSADLEIERRILGLATAATFVVIGNAMPKILTPLSILPLPLAERVSSARWSAVAGVLTVLGAIVWMNVGPSRGEGT